MKKQLLSLICCTIFSANTVICMQSSGKRQAPSSEDDSNLSSSKKQKTSHKSNNQSVEDSFIKDLGETFALEVGRKVIDYTKKQRAGLELEIKALQEKHAQESKQILALAEETEKANEDLISKLEQAYEDKEKYKQKSLESVLLEIQIKQLKNEKETLLNDHQKTNEELNSSIASLKSNNEKLHAIVNELLNKQINKEREKYTKAFKLINKNQEYVDSEEIIALIEYKDSLSSYATARALGSKKTIEQYEELFKNYADDLAKAEDAFNKMSDDEKKELFWASHTLKDTYPLVFAKFCDLLDQSQYKHMVDDKMQEAITNS